MQDLTPWAVSDNSGVVQTEYIYEAFGRATATGASNSSSYQYTGRENDGTGLFYYRARFYHPQLQRFISEDPIEFFGGDINLYGYVRNSPLTFVDPSGLDKKPKRPTRPSPPWGPPLGPDTPPPAGPLPPDCPLGPDSCFGGNRAPNAPAPPPAPHEPRDPRDLNGDGRYDNWDWLLWGAMRRLYDLMSPVPGLPNPPGYGDQGPGTTDPNYGSPPPIL